jgi:hypothetical protein
MSETTSLQIGIRKISNAAYHAGHGLSSTDLKYLLRSAAHYKAYKEAENEPTAEMIRGTLVHALILEPDTFESEFAVGQFNIHRGKEYEKCLAENPGKTIVSHAEYDEATFIKRAFDKQVSESTALQRLMQGMKETAFFWKDPATDVLCKCKPDILTPHGAIVDIKTARDASFDAFQKQLVDLQYFVSAAHYLTGVNETVSQMGDDVHPLVIAPPKAFVFIVIETKEPYPVATYYLDAKSLEMGKLFCERAIDTYQDALSTNKWCGYPRKLVEMGLPNWAYFRANYLGVRDNE